MNCIICEKDYPSYSWTDTHGVAQCVNCGTPYRIYHYEGEGVDAKRVEKPAECILQDKYIPLVKKYWDEHKRKMPSGCSFGFGSYELASREDADAFYEWMEANKVAEVAQ